MRAVMIGLAMMAGGCGAAGGTVVLMLDEGWSFSQAGSDTWLEAKVPGTVHSDLLRHNLLPDPFYGKNEEKIQWVEDEDWVYRTSFNIDAAMLEHDAAFLNMKGLDTYADVYLNDSLILSADNMFVGHKVAVKHLLREGENHLRLYFHSPIKRTLPLREADGFDYPADNDHRKEKVSVYSRKAPYSYGWDWGIRMVTCGIWRPISLSFHHVAAITDCYIRQQSVSAEKAQIEAQIEVENLTDAPQTTLATVSWQLPDGEPQQATRELSLKPGANRIELPVEIDEPKLWMPNGWGEATLYDFTVMLSHDGIVVDGEHQRVGLRNVEVVKEKDEHGESFYFKVNGVKLFAKGANYIPSDAILPNVTEERYANLFRDVKDANMNMLRVWGGGVYEDDRFYELADENGILIWQDFMFACTTYPHDNHFLAKVKAEAEYNIRRLRGHACLAMWCGNNEILEGIKYWGWKSRYSPEVYAKMQEGYHIIFEQLLPTMVSQLDEGRFYMHGSPYFANWGRPDSWRIADSHNWGIWYGQKPFESLDSEIPRFMSEFGFQSFPEMKTIATFASEDDYALESEVMNAHQKASTGTFLIKKTMGLYYDVPDDFETLVYQGQVLQGYGVRHGIEAHRRNRPYCMGSLYWQLNDSWPVVSWSSIDYYGNWKALHYQAKRAFAPVIINAVQEDGNLQLWAISDLLQDLPESRLELQLFDFKGLLLREQTHTLTIGANSSAMVISQPLSDWGNPETHKTTYLLLTLKDKEGKVHYQEPYYFTSPKHLSLPEDAVKVEVKNKYGECEVTLSSPTLAKDIFVEVPNQGARFSDNFFDLLPNRPRTITITSPTIKARTPAVIKVRHLKRQ